MVGIIVQLKEKVPVSYRSLCDQVHVSYASFMRWKQRMKAGLPVVMRPGPRKLSAVQTSALLSDLQLNHRKKRTLGTGALSHDLREQISRREFHFHVDLARDRSHRELLENMRRLTWCLPNSTWALDDTGRRGLPYAGPFHIHHVRELTTRLGLSAIVTPRLLSCEQVADNLERLFHQFGPPLVLKCDLGSNLNGHPVLALLDQYGVLLLNSPPHCPRYNGHLERAQRELKADIAACLQHLGLSHPDLPLLARLAPWCLAYRNHTPRPCLRGATPAKLFALGHHCLSAYTLSRRKEVIHLIQENAQSIYDHLGPRPQRQLTARRLAVQNWLLKQGLIIVSRGSKCYPLPPESGLIFR